MKLYFYLLEKPYGGEKSYIRLEECETDDLPKSYMMVSDAFADGYACVRRDKIGSLQAHDGIKYISSMRKDDAVNEKFFQFLQERIDELKEMLSAAKNGKWEIRRGDGTD